MATVGMDPSLQKVPPQGHFSLPPRNTFPLQSPMWTCCLLRNLYLQFCPSPRAGPGSFWVTLVGTHVIFLGKKLRVVDTVLPYTGFESHVDLCRGSLVNSCSLWSQACYHLSTGTAIVVDYTVDIVGHMSTPWGKKCMPINSSLISLRTEMWLSEETGTDSSLTKPTRHNYTTYVLRLELDKSSSSHKPRLFCTFL